MQRIDDVLAESVGLDQQVHLANGLPRHVRTGPPSLGLDWTAVAQHTHHFSFLSMCLNQRGSSNTSHNTHKSTFLQNSGLLLLQFCQNGKYEQNHKSIINNGVPDSPRFPVDLLIFSASSKYAPRATLWSILSHS